MGPQPQHSQCRLMWQWQMHQQAVSRVGLTLTRHIAPTHREQQQQLQPPLHCSPTFFTPETLTPRPITTQPQHAHTITHSLTGHQCDVTA